MPDSKAQVRAAHAALNGESTIGMSKDFARDVVQGMHGKKMSSLPERKTKKMHKPKGKR